MHPGIASSPGPLDSAMLAAVLALAALVTVPVVGLALAAFVRRRSRSYLLVVLALVALLARTAVAVAMFVGAVSMDLHHVAEHGLDVLMAALVVAAVYYARTVERSGGDPR